MHLPLFQRIHRAYQYTWHFSTQGKQALDYGFPCPLAQPHGGTVRLKNPDPLDFPRSHVIVAPADILIQRCFCEPKDAIKPLPSGLSPGDT